MRFFFLIILVLTACTGDTAPVVTPSPLTSGFFFVDEVVSGRASNGPVSVTGYLYAGGPGVVLVDSLSLARDGPPLPNTINPAEQLWISPSLDSTLQRVLQRSDDVLYGVVQARGRLEGPANFGPAGEHRYRLAQASLTLLEAQELTISALLEDPGRYAGRLVLVNGELLINADSALLVNQLGVGGVPDPTSRQIKLAHRLQDEAVLQHLTSVPDSPVRFGPVRVEGVWHQGVLHPLAAVPLDTSDP